MRTSNSLKAFVLLLVLLMIGVLGGVLLQGRREATEVRPEQPTVLDEAQRVGPRQVHDAPPLAQAGRAELPGEATHSQEPSAPAETEPPLAVLAEHVLGHVRDLDGRGVPGVEVVFEVHTERGHVARKEAPLFTTGDGSFTLQLPAATGRLSVTSPFWAAIVRPRLAGRVPDEPALIVVAPRHTWSGTVVGADGAPIDLARVEVSVAGDWLQALEVAGRALPLLLPLAETKSDAAGRFSFDGVGFVSGAFLEASRDGLTPARHELSNASEHGIVLTLLAHETERAVHGLVLTPDGTPAAQALVSMGVRSVHSGPDGRFALALEEWREDGVLQAVKHGHLPGTARFDPDRPAGTSAEQPLTLVLGPTPLALRGRVLDADGRPAANVVVYTPDTTYFGQAPRDADGITISGDATVEALVHDVRRRWFEPLETRTDAAGRFALEGLLDREYALYALDPRTLAAATPRLVRAGRDGIELRLEPEETKRVAGRVLSERGVPQPDVRVSVGRTVPWERPGARPDHLWDQAIVGRPDPGWSAFEQPLTTTDSEGRFALEGLVLAGSQLVLSGAAIQFTRVDLEPRANLDALELRVRARCRFHVVLASDPGQASSFGLLDAEDRVVPLYVRVEEHTISTPRVDLPGGRSTLTEAFEGEHVLVLYDEAGNEVRRLPILLEAGALRDVRL